MAIKVLEDTDLAEKQPRSKFKPKKGLGHAVTRKRRMAADALEEQIARRKAASQEAAIRELERLRNRSKQEAVRDTWAPSLIRNVADGQIALMRAWGYTTAFSVGLDEKRPHVMAYTDFSKIVVKWPTHSLPNRLDRDAVLDTVAQLKGVLQHEMGHVRFTTPWINVLAEAVQSDLTVPCGLLHKCWNMLEDQRMECLVVESVPRIASYFGTMVANVVLNGGNLPVEQTWLMLAGRTYFPQHVLKQSYMLFDQFCFDQGISNGALTWSNLVGDFKAADTEQKIMDATEAAYRFIQDIRATMPEVDHSGMDEDTNDVDPADAARQPGSILDMFDEKPKPPSKSKPKNRDDYSEPAPGDASEGHGQGQGDSDDQGEDDGEGQGQGQQDDGDGDEGQGQGQGQGDGDSEGDGADTDGQVASQSNGSGDSTSFVDEKALTDALHDMMSQCQQDIRSDSDVTDALRKTNAAADRDGLPDYMGDTQAMSVDLMTRAMFTAAGIEKALNSFVTQSAPIWQNRKDVGVIDPLAYRTKAVGERNFRRHLDDHGNTALDVHVSMLCDVSGSMGGSYYGGEVQRPIVALSEALYAMATACNNLGIGATYTLWSSGGQNYRVWADNNPQPVIWPAMGGTDPMTALDDLDTHNKEEAASHLVVIFTDGAWANNFPSLTRWAADGRTIVLVRYGAYDGDMQKDMGAHKHINIKDVSALPEELTRSLIEVLSAGNGW